jgi:ABC-type transporter Mla MlaB component
MIKRGSLRQGVAHAPVRAVGIGAWGENLSAPFCQVRHRFEGVSSAKAPSELADKPPVDVHKVDRGTGAMGSKSVQGKGGGGARVIALPADFRLAGLADVKASLLEALDAPAVQLDGSSVERVDTAALQLLLTFCRGAMASGKTPTWSGVSDVMRDAAGVLGLVKALELPATMPA